METLIREKKNQINDQSIIVGNVTDSISKSPEELVKRCIQELKNINIQHLKKLGVHQNASSVCNVLEEQKSYYVSIFEILAEIQDVCGDDFKKLEYLNMEAEVELDKNNVKTLEAEVFLKNKQSNQEYTFYVDAIQIDDLWYLLKIELFDESSEEEKRLKI